MNCVRSLPRLWILFTVFSVSCCIGCLESPKGAADLGPMAAASGIVKIDGQPAKEILVTYYPQGGKGAPGRGKTLDNGRYIITTASKNDGAAVGAHVVTVQMMMTGTLPGREGTAPGSVKIPAKYESQSTSPLSVTVENGKPNDFTIEIDTKQK
jgi:hypothetical protein